MEEICVIAHHGDSLKQPSSTMYAYIDAIENVNIDGVKMCLQKTKDDVFVLYDAKYPRLKSFQWNKKISNYTLEELKKLELCYDAVKYQKQVLHLKKENDNPDTEEALFHLRKLKERRSKMITLKEALEYLDDKLLLLDMSMLKKEIERMQLYQYLEGIDMDNFYLETNNSNEAFDKYSHFKKGFKLHKTCELQSLETPIDFLECSLDCAYMNRSKLTQLEIEQLFISGVDYRLDVSKFMEFAEYYHDFTKKYPIAISECAPLVKLLMKEKYNKKRSN